MRWKSLFFSIFLTVLLSTVVFLSVVFLGMKYHWVEAFTEGNKQFTELKIPESSGEGQALSNSTGIVLPTMDKTMDNGARTEVTEIIENRSNRSPLANMTKKQVLEYCQNRFKTQGFSDDAIIVAVGNCVVTNYQEPYQEAKPDSLNVASQGDLKPVNYPGSESSQKQGKVKAQHKPHSNNSRQAKVNQDAIRHRCTFEINKQTLLSLNEKKLLIETCVQDLSR